MVLCCLQQSDAVWSSKSFVFQELPKIRAHTLIIHGMKDPIAPEYHAVYLHENIKGSRWVCIYFFYIRDK